jgi:hypothetical protein
MEEVMKVLGWIINTRSLTTSLPHDKHSKWSSSIDTIISEGKCNIKNLEILLGRLNHAANILLSMHHHSWKALQKSKQSEENQLDKDAVD